MGINLQKLKRHIDDYASTTGERKSRFVCPITFRECEVEELIDGHILNRAIKGVSRRTVIQYSDVDHFYGTKVEPALVKYINLAVETGKDFLSGSRDFFVEFDDGSKAEAFFGNNAAGVKFPRITFNNEIDSDFDLFLRVEHDDPRLNTGRVSLSTSHIFKPSHWIAALLKAAFLTSFEMVGYRAVFTAWGEDLPGCLSRLYRDRDNFDESLAVFERYKNCIKLSLRIDSKSPDSMGFDSIRDRIVLLNKTKGGVYFSSTYVFQVRDLSLLVTLPQSINNVDPKTVLDNYDKLMETPDQLSYTAHQAKFEGNVWNLTSEGRQVYYDSAPSVDDK